MSRLGAAKSMEADEILVEKHLGADQATNPASIGHEGMSQKVDDAAIVGASQVDDAAGRMLLKVERPRTREKTTRRRRVVARSVTTLRGQDVAFGSLLELGEIGGNESMNDLALPESVERFDGGLEAGLARRSEDGSDVEGEAQPDDASESVGEIVGSLEAGVVVELSVSGQAVLTPASQQGLEDEVGGDVEARPGIDEPTMERDGVEAVDIARFVSERKVFDDVEGVEFDETGGEIGEIPAGGRRSSTNASPAVENAVASEDSSDGPDGGERRDALLAEMTMDRLIAELAEIAAQAEMIANLQDTAFEIGGNASGSSRSAGSIGEVDAVESLVLSSSNPALHGAQGNSTLPSDGPKRLAGTNETDDLEAASEVGVFWPREVLLEQSGDCEQCSGRQARRTAQRRKRRQLQSAYGLLPSPPLPSLSERGIHRLPGIGSQVTRRY